MEYALLLKSHDPETARQLLQERYSLSGAQKPFLVLHNSPAPAAGAQGSQRRLKRKSTTNRNLAAFIATGDRHYDTYRPLAELWDQYIVAAVGTNTNARAAAQSVLSADWHGAQVSVEAARNAALVGLAGILLWESQHQMLVVTRNNEFKQVPKSGTIFRLHVPGLNQAFKLVGDRIQCRSTERTTRKFKPHDVADIAVLLGGEC